LLDLTTAIVDTDSAIAWAMANGLIAGSRQCKHCASFGTQIVSGGRREVLEMPDSGMQDDHILEGRKFLQSKL